MTSLLAVLCLPANTSFVGFPRLCELMALDGFLLLRLGGVEAEEDVAELRRRWEADIAQPLAEAGHTAPRLVLLPAQYREIDGPLLELVAKIDAATSGWSVAILIPELVVARVWQRLLHSRRAARLRAALVVTAGPRLMVITSPWRAESK